ncbi:MAG TPA: hypothetical protein VF400_09125 [Anaeromyxobacteraceae bacterium]
MATYVGGTAVKRGYYIDGASFEFTTVERDGSALPGGPERRWLHLPVLVVMAAAPALGGLFVVAFPLIGFGVLAYSIAKKLVPAARAGVREIGATLSPSWVPGEAHLTGEEAPKAADASPSAKPGSERLDALQSEIEEARKGKA